MNRAPMRRALINRGTRANTPSDPPANLISPLHLAAEQGHPGLVHLLVSQGADPLLKEPTHHLTPIHIAAKYGQHFVLIYFLSLKLSPDITDSAGHTPLMLAAAAGHKNDYIARLLVQYGAGLNHQDDALGNTALHWALYSGSFPIAKTLIQNGADLAVKNQAGVSPLELLMHGNSASVSKRERQDLLLLVAHKLQVSPDRLLSFNNSIREWPAALIPLILFVWTGKILDSSSHYCIKFCWILMLLIAQHLAMRNANTAQVRLAWIFPLSFCLTIKLILCWTWFLWFWALLPWVPALLFITTATISSREFMLCLKDPGFCFTTAHDRDKYVMELCESNLMDDRHWCATCMLRKPLRSKHCQHCDKCVARFDHHCPLLQNCIGWRNHGHYLFFLIHHVASSCLYAHAATVFWNCSSSSSTPSNNSLGWLHSLGSHPMVTLAVLGAGLEGLVSLGLLTLQLYQILWLGMTTNERLNWERYHAEQYSAFPFDQFPFHRGPLSNLLDFLLLHSLTGRRTDWNYKYALDQPQNAKSKPWNPVGHPISSRM